MAYLYLRSCCKIPFLKNYASVVSIKNFHSISRQSCLLKSHFPASTQVRPFWECFPSVRPLFYEKDGLSRSKYELIYRAKIFNYVFYGQFVASVTLAIQICGGLYYACRSYIAQDVIPTVTNVGPFIVNYDLPTIFIITLFTIQNCGIIVCAQNAILRGYYSEDTDEYVFVNLSLNPFKSKLYHCKPGDLIPLKERMFSFLFGNHEVNGKKMYIRYDKFKNMYHYNHLIGDNIY